MPHADHAANQPARTPAEIAATLAGISPRRQAFSRVISGTLDASTTWLQRHWLALVNSVLALFILTAVLVPLGYAFGLSSSSSVIFNTYHWFCAQTPSHSFYVAGYQMCLCSRCLAIYSSLLGGGLLLALLREQRSVRALSWKLWLLAMVPMGLDGGTQMFGWRESNDGLRVLTGVIFGLATALYVLPQLHQAAADGEYAPARTAQQTVR